MYLYFNSLSPYVESSLFNRAEIAFSLLASIKDEANGEAKNGQSYRLASCWNLFGSVDTDRFKMGFMTAHMEHQGPMAYSVYRGFLPGEYFAHGLDREWFRYCEPAHSWLIEPTCAWFINSVAAPYHMFSQPKKGELDDYRY